jgi:hypothetical protein
MEKLASETGSEITFMADGRLDWYWKSIRIQPTVEQVPQIVEALKTLMKIGCEKSL